jgi:hypothetical protein
MAYHVYPTETPVGIFEVDPSNRLREYQWAQFEQFRALCSLSAFKLSGGLLSIGAGITADIAEGQWFIDGRYVRNGSIVNTGNLGASQVNYIYFQLTYTGSLVTAVVEYDTSSTTPPANSVLVGTATTDGSSVTSVASVVTVTGPIYSGSYTGNGDSPRTILLGFQPKHVEVYGQKFTGTDTEFISFSGGVVVRSGESATDVVTYSTSYVYVPVPVVTGFQVGRTYSYGLNVSGETYYYRAFI